MRHLGYVCLGFALVSSTSCGGGDDSGLDGAGGSTGGASNGGTGGSGGSGGAAAGAGGAGGGDASVGGTAGSSSGGNAGSTSGGGGSGGSLVDGGSTDCPTAAPTQGSACTTAGTVCCYGSAPEKPWRCVPTSPDGGGSLQWVTLQSKVCCPVDAPQIGQACNAPGDLACCYGDTGFSCNAQPNPDVWATAACN